MPPMMTTTNMGSMGAELLCIILYTEVIDTCKLICIILHTEVLRTHSVEHLVTQDIESVLKITGLTAEEFAKELGISRGFVSKWINHRNTISEKNVHEF